MKIEISRYPDTNYVRLKDSIARYTGTKKNHVAVGNGADDLILLITALFGKRIIIPTPSFITYALAAKTIGKKIKYVNCLQKGYFEIPKIHLQKNDVLWIHNPNNPLGEYTSIENILSKISGNGLIVIDEAYIEFVGKQTVNPKLFHKPNLIILRSFSKGWPLAGLRVGYTITNPKLTKKIESNRLMFPINSIASELVPIILEKDNFFKKERIKTCENCRKLINIFQEYKIPTSDTVANFFCAKFSNRQQAIQFYKKMAKYNVRLLPPNDKEFIGLPSNYLRICTPMSQHMPQMKHAIKNTLSEIN